MTPPPATAAAAGHQRSVRRGTGPRGPRRVSGPSRAAGGARAARANQAAAAAAAAAVNPNQLPFEVPIGGRAAVARPVGVPRTHVPLVRRIGQVAEHSWLDRLLRSRAWIVVVGVGLIGLVFMQVSLLKLNSGMGRDVERSTVLERENALNRAAVSQLESNDRIQQAAIAMGMLLPASDGVRYLGKDGKRIGGGTTTQVPSQAEASTALLPAAPVDDTEHPTTTSTTGTSTTATPQSTSSVPGAAAATPVAQTSATGVTEAGTTTGTAGTGSTGTGTGSTATGTTAAATGATGTTAAGTGGTGAAGTTGAGTTGTAATGATAAATGTATRSSGGATATGGATPGA